MVSAIGLWRHYPRLLLQASSEHSLPSDSEDLKRLLDPKTVRALAASLSDPDPDVARAAAELISEAEPATAAPTLATAIESAPPLTRPALIESLQVALESSPPGKLHDARASTAIARVLANPEASRQKNALISFRFTRALRSLTQSVRQIRYWMRHWTTQKPRFDSRPSPS